MNSYRSRWLAVALLCAPIFSGCHGGVKTDILERELRKQEDRIWELQGYIEEYQGMLESCRRENRTLKKQLGMLDSPSAPGDSHDSSPVPELFTPPVVEPGIPSEAEQDGPLDLSPEPPGAEESLEETDPESEAPAFTPPQSRAIERIELNKLLSGGLNSDGRGGDEGVMAVIQPRTADGQIVPVEASISLMVRDPNQKGLAGQLARWDFDTSEVDGRWQESVLGRGFHFELPWPSDPPARRRLQLWARLVTPDGQKLLTKIPIDVDPDGRTAAQVGLGRTASRWNRQRGRFTPRPLAPTTAATPAPLARGTDWEVSPVSPPPLSPPPRAIEVPDETGEKSVVVSKPKKAEIDTDTPDQEAAKEDAKPTNTPVARRRPEWKPYR